MLTAALAAESAASSQWRLAHAMTAFGDEVRRLLAERDMSLRQLAKRSNFDNGYLSKILRGVKRPTPAVAARLDEILGAGGSVAALAGDGSLFNGDLPLEGRERLAYARQHPSRADTAAVESLAAVLAGQRRAEDALGSAAVLVPVKAQMSVINGLLTEAQGTVRPGVVDMAAQWAQFTGWLHANTGDLAAAAARFSQTIELAAETGDVTMTATALSYKGHLAWLTGDVGPMIGLSQAAQRDRSIAASQLAYNAAQEARGHAMAGDGGAAERKLGEALALAHGAAGDPEQVRPWSYWYTPAFFELQAGLVYRYLGADPRYRARAVAALTAGHAGLDADGRASEWGAVFLYHLAAVHAQDGDVAQACAVALNVAGIARATSSTRLIAMLRRLRAGLAARWPQDPGVAELADALR